MGICTQLWHGTLKIMPQGPSFLKMQRRPFVIKKMACLIKKRAPQHTLAIVANAIHNSAIYWYFYIWKRRNSQLTWFNVNCLHGRRYFRKTKSRKDYPVLHCFLAKEIKHCGCLHNPRSSLKCITSYSRLSSLSVNTMVAEGLTKKQCDDCLTIVLESFYRWKEHLWFTKRVDMNVTELIQVIRASCILYIFVIEAW